MVSVGKPNRTGTKPLTDANGRRAGAHRTQRVRSVPAQSQSPPK